MLTEEREIEPGGERAVIERVYDPNLNPAEVIAAEGQRTTFTYDSRDLATSTTRGAGTPVASTESTAYDLEGRTVSMTDGRGETWTTTYDGFGRAIESADPLGNRRQTEYDNAGQAVAAEQLGAGSTLSRTETAYDLLGRQTEHRRLLWSTGGPAGAETLTTATSFDAAGNVLQVTDPLGRSTSHEYDAAERLVATVDPAGNRMEYELDAGGNARTVRSIEVVPSGGSEILAETATHDALGRTLSATDPIGNTSQFLYDARGNRRFVLDPEGFVTERVYDGLGRLVREAQPEGLTIDYGYDRSSRRTSYRDALGNTTTWSYDALGRETSVTYADQASVAQEYDPAGNPIRVTDALGTVIDQSFDPASRLVSRTITPLPAAGVIGPLAESFAYDGLSRLTQATSGSVVTTLGYDSLSRKVSETTEGQTVSYGYDAAGNRTRIDYPSGESVLRSYDLLDRPAAVADAAAPASPEASWTYRGPGRVETKSLGAELVATHQYDPARRLVSGSWTDSAGSELFAESLAWSPRGLKSGISRSDLNGEGWLLSHDGAGRLVEAGRGHLASLPQNQAVSPSAAAALPRGERFTYDAAQNLLARQRRTAGIATEALTLPLDGSGRNRPAAVGDTALTWNANGNLVAKGDWTYQYDWRNRLTRIADGAGQEVASFTYDAFNRRIRETYPGTVRTSVWSDWQMIEQTTDGLLSERRVYGAGLDEVVRLERDLDADGALEHAYRPLYDSTGNVVLLVTNDGRLTERYKFSAYGERTVLADATPPTVEQVRVVGDEVWVELSEAVSEEALAQALSAAGVVLMDEDAGEPVDLLAEQPVTSGRLAGRRVVLSPDDEPASGTNVTLTLEPEAVRDLFLNQPSSAYQVSFAWPSADTVIADHAAPRVDQVVVRERVAEVQFSEEVDLASAAAAITIEGQISTWTLSEDRYTLIGGAALADGDHTLAITTGLFDQAGTGLAEPVQLPVVVSAEAPSSVAYQAPDTRASAVSLVGNALGFQGHPHDPETGLLFVRNRYLSSELGGFITADPLGYVDGPSIYTFAGNDPVNNRDPLGLYIVGGQRELEAIKQVLTAVGEEHLASLLRLKKTTTPTRFLSLWRWITRQTDETRIEFAPRAGDVDNHPNEIVRLFASAIKTGVRIELSITDGVPHPSGAKTSAYENLVELFKPDRPDEENKIMIAINPELVKGTLVPGPDGMRIHVPFEAALVHEFGHAYYYYALRGFVPVLGVGKAETNRSSVDWENKYRDYLGLPARTAHD